MCPRGGGKERKRLYEEGLTAGAVTAATVVAMGKERGNFVGNKGLLLPPPPPPPPPPPRPSSSLLLPLPATVETGSRGRVERGECSQFWTDGGIVGISTFRHYRPYTPVVQPTDRLPGRTTTTATATATYYLYRITRSLRSLYQLQRAFTAGHTFTHNEGPALSHSYY